MYKEAISPKSATHAGEVIIRITEWESKVKDLNKEEDVTLDPMIMLATLTEICTPEIKDMIYQQGDGLFKDKHPTAMKRAFDDVREKIISRTSNKIASSSANLNVGIVPSHPNTFLRMGTLLGSCQRSGSRMSLRFYSTSS